MKTLIEDAAIYISVMLYSCYVVVSLYSVLRSYIFDSKSERCCNSLASDLEYYVSMFPFMR